VTAPPPGGVAEFNYVDDLIRVSEGVAYAFECSDNGPCSSLAAEVAEPQIALAYIAHLTVPERWSSGTRNVTAFVVVGQKAGKTQLLVRNGSNNKRYTVEVLPAIQPSTASTSSAPPVLRMAPAGEPAPVPASSAPPAASSSAH
jgi:hypothetical protein